MLPVVVLMRSNSTKSLLLVAVIIFGFIVVFLLSGFIEKNNTALPDGFEDEDLTLQGAKLKGFALGFEGLIADWYWMKSLQYIGDKIIKSNQPITLDNLKPLNPRLLYPYLDNASDLDPRFTAIYEYGAIVLPSIDETQAIKIAEKGVANNPEQWRLYHYLGFTYWTFKEYEKASQIYEKGSTIKDAPAWMKLMSAKIRIDGGSRDTARTIYRQMFEQATDENIRKSAELRLYQLDSLDEQEVINSVLQNFKAKTGRCANNLKEILPLLKNVKLPDGKDFHLDKSNNLIDPSGAPYLFDNKNCIVNLSPDSQIPKN
jgi:tetratricopeptide (TPR) repeat protein